jgi:hypothetical protein
MVNQDFLLELSFPRRRESSSSKNACEAGQLPGFVRFVFCFFAGFPPARDERPLEAVFWRLSGMASSSINDGFSI